MTPLESLRKTPLYRETRTALEAQAQSGNVDMHLFDAWTIMLAVEDHIAAVVADTEIERMLASAALRSSRAIQPGRHGRA